MKQAHLDAELKMLVWPGVCLFLYTLVLMCVSHYCKRRFMFSRAKKGFISIISMLAPCWPVCICSCCSHLFTNTIQTSKVSKIRAFFPIRYSLRADSHCVPVTGDSCTEWVTESSWIHFKLHWIEVRGFKCSSVCTKNQKTLNFWHHLHFLVPEKKIGGNQVRLVSKVVATARPKASVAMSLTCWYVCGIVRVHLRANTFVFHWGLFLRVKPCQILSQTWACEFVDTKNVLVLFLLINFLNYFLFYFFAKCTC